jgi:signal transduction histidine kinase
MTKRKDLNKNRLRELEITLEEERSLSKSRNTLLEANIKELDDIYIVLNEKLKSLRAKDERINSFQAELVRANKLSSLGELAGSIAHEIKNPLVSIQGFAKRIGKTKDPDKIENYAKLIDKEAGRLTNVLMKLLDFSRMDEPKKERIELGEVVDDTVLFMEHHLTRFKNVAISVERDKKPAHAVIDKIHVQQVLVNLINNAAQTMPRGGTIHIRSGVKKGYGYIAITDEGEGIAPEILDRLFEPFFTTKPKGEGTGLGLSLSKKLVEANNGRIEVATQKDEGSTFTLLFPLADQDVTDNQ